MKKIVLSLLIFTTSVVLSGCQNHKTTNYSMGDERYSISSRGNSLIDQDDIKEVCYTEASELCPNGFKVEEIKEKRKNIEGYNKPGLEGVIKCE